MSNSDDKLTKAEQRQLAEGVRRIVAEREAFAGSMQDLARPRNADDKEVPPEYLADIDKLRSEATKMRELAKRILVGEWRQGPPDVRYIDRPNEYDPPTEIEIEEFQRRAKMISYSTDPMRCETIHMVDESTGPLDPPSSLPTKKKELLIIKCSFGGCGTILEAYWRFCPSCGTSIAFEVRHRLLRKEHGV